MNLFFKIFVFIFSISLLNECSAHALQTELSKEDSMFVVSSISIQGNKKTRPGIILRELLFSESDTIYANQLDSVIRQSRLNVINTNLFLTVDLDTFVISNRLIVEIKLKERWYTWPNIIFEFADRNLNTWWETRDFRRTSYGMYFYQENFRGRNERISVRIRMQYTEELGFGYSIPYLNKNKKSGLAFSVSRARWREASYRSLNNKQVFHKHGDQFMRKESSAGVTYTYRPKYYNSHAFSAEYKHNEIHDTIAKLNRDYFLEGQTKQSYIRFTYKIKRDRRDITAYPLKGYYFDFEVVPTFIRFDTKPLNLLWFTSTFKKFFRLQERIHYAFSVKGKLSGTAKQPYFNELALGYREAYVRSYEYYVTDGQHYALFRSNLKYTLLKTTYFSFHRIPLSKFNMIPVAIYLNGIADCGYVWNHQDYLANSLTNSLLIGYGLGLDYVTYYSMVVRCEYTINKMGERGFFVHVSLPI